MVLERVGVASVARVAGALYAGLMAWLYNLVASRFGGVEVELG